MNCNILDRKLNIKRKYCLKRQTISTHPFKSAHMKSQYFTYLITATLLAALSACSSLGLGGGQADSSLEASPKLSSSADSFPGAPLPVGSKIKQDQSFIIGSGENWLGRLSVDIGRDTDTAYRYFLQSYPQNGWTLISSVRTAKSLLVFTKGERNLTIEVNEGSFFMSGEAVLTVSPTPRNTQQPGNLGNPAMRGSSVNVQPIR